MYATSKRLFVALAIAPALISATVGRVHAQQLMPPSAPIAARPTIAVAPKPVRRDPKIAAALALISADTMRYNLNKLVSFGTRHTMSDTLSETRGIGAARRWIFSRMQEFSQRCGGCLEVSYDPHDVKVERFPGTPTAHVVNVVAKLKGRTDPRRVAVFTGHFDSCVCSVDARDATSDAPGANDDASGTIAVMELARVFSKQFPQGFDGTIIFAPVAGEEQGLLGSTGLAQDLINDTSIVVAGDITNDIAGNIWGQKGDVDSMRVRVFAPEPDDGPSRQWGRYIVEAARAYVPGFDVSLIGRLDRIGRGGDHRPFWNLGAPAVRVSESVENYNRQHRPEDTPDKVSTTYVRRIAQVDGAALAELASAPAAPTGQKMQRSRESGGADWALSWNAVPNAPDLAGYEVTIRKTTDPFVTRVVPVGNVTQYTLDRVQADDFWIGVRSVDAGGHRSLVSSFHGRPEQAEKIPSLPQPQQPPRRPAGTPASTN